MNIPGNFFLKGFFIFILSCIVVSILDLHGTSFAESAGQEAAEKEKIENYDIRTDQSEAARSLIGTYIGESGKTFAEIAARRRNSLEAANEMRSKSENLKIEYNEDLRVAEVISPDFNKKTGFLTAPSGSKRTEILENFLKQNSELFALDAARIAELKTSADYTNPNGVLSFVHFEQRIGRIPVFRGEVKAGFTRKNEIVRIINNLAPDLDEKSLSADFGNPAEAVRQAARHINITADESDIKAVGAEPYDLKITFERGRFADKTTAEKMYFPLDWGVALPAWRILLWTRNEAFYVIVDARRGTLLWRKNITENQTQTATFNVYGNQTNPLKLADNPTPLTTGCTNPNDCPQPPLISRQNFTLIGNEAPYSFNNLGWIPDSGLAGTANPSGNITDGNAVEAGIDRDGINGVDAPVAGTSRVFNFTYNPAPGNPPPGENPLLPEYQKGAVTNAFYAVNRWHDEMYLFGFNEQAGNFQHFNFGRGGAEGDRISAEIQDSSGTNNANFAAPADGGRPRMQMYLWTNTTPNRDGSLDAHVLIHETTHGLSTRLHGNSSGLSTPMASGLGEGWSDLYPLALLSKPDDDVFGLHAVGGYASVGLFPGNSYYYGARRFPYAPKAKVGQNGFPHNPLTLAHLNQGNCSTFNSAFPPRFTFANSCGAALFIGEVWAAALWEVRGQFVLRHGAAEGNRRVLQIITDAMKLSPLNPTILQSRDAVLIAAQANSVSPETNVDLLDAWRGFAIRGIGANAQILSSNPVNAVESFDIPTNINQAPTHIDFDGDRKTDISIFRPTAGEWWYLRSSDLSNRAFAFGSPSDKITPADYTGDGKTDVAFWRESTGEWFILRSEDSSFYSFPFGSLGDIPAPADFDGDGRADPAVFRPSNATWYIVNSSDNSTTIAQFGASGDLPVAADYDGDSKADLAVFRPSDGSWWLNRSSAGLIVTNFGSSTDKTVQADYTGDGKADVAFFRPSSGEWFILRSEDFSFYSFPFGASGDIPSPGDYDGDGRTDPAVFRNSAATWYLLRSTSGFTALGFGASGDIPVPSAFVR